MRSVFQRVCVLLSILAVHSLPTLAQDARPPAGLALVIATTNHPTMTSPTADQGAGLIAAALAERQYSIISARNLDDASLKAALDEFKARIASSPALPVFVYFGGPVLQLEQDNLVLAGNTSLASTGDLVKQSLSLNALIKDLTKISSGKKIIVIDGSRAPAQIAWPSPIASGLAIPDDATNLTISFNQTPGLSTSESAAGISGFAHAWADAISEGAKSSQALVDFITLRSFVLSNGQLVAWSKISKDKPESMFPKRTGDDAPWVELHSKPMNSLNATEGLAAALLRQSLISYEEYILIHIQTPATRFSRAILASLREAMIWKEASAVPSASGAWAYLQVYPRGPHAAEAKLLLAKLGKPVTPPADASILALVTTPPTNDELALLTQSLPYRLNADALDLAQFATMFKTRWPDLGNKETDLPKDMTSSSAFGLPLPQMEPVLASLIQLPALLPQLPAPVVEAPKTKKPEKISTPLPPRRNSDDADTSSADGTILIPNSEPIQEPSAEPSRPAQSGPISNDIFNQPFGTAPSQTTLPY